MNQTKPSNLAQILAFLCLFVFYWQSVHAQQAVPVIENANLNQFNIIQGVFDIPELRINPSPNVSQQFTLSDSEKVIDYDISPVGSNVACLVTDKEGKNTIKFWQIGQSRLLDSMQLPKALYAKSIAWHPQANALFVMGINGGTYQIFKIQKQANNWMSNRIYSTPTKLRRLVVCPRPFITNYDYKTKRSYYNYRLFFGMSNGADGTYRIVSITENGSSFYQVVGPSKTFTKDNSKTDQLSPSNMEASFALPIAFHPAGHQLIWQDEKNKFYSSTYDSRYWGKYKPIDLAIPNNGTITPTPNGLGLIHWQKSQRGIDVYLLATRGKDTQLKDYQFISPPSSVPDGKGIVGLTHSNGKYSLNYLPINVPLAEVTNAWMYITSGEEIELFQRNSGLFRPNQYDQLYKLYESENYYCNGYDRTSPTRPYMVTTDIFWELFSAAYEGLFIVKERDQAIPNFCKFIESANDYCKTYKGQSKWEPVFSVLKDFIHDKNNNKEVARIQGEKDGVSEITHSEYAYSDLKPRGHYASSKEMSQYFKAFRYFTTILKDTTALKELNSLPQEIKSYAAKWIESYSGFIAPSRSPLVWDNLNSVVPKYCKTPLKKLSIFPLSWGFDNEVLKTTIYNSDAPEELQLPGRMLPSGLDLAAALGDGFAEKLLETDFEKYPNLRKIIHNLKVNYRENTVSSGDKTNLYSGWLEAMAIQLADGVPSPNGEKGRDIWQTKRLQTGLATWATLRHASILVNETTAAECGEGGFEEILMRAPRGYVEPDPATFGATAELFERAISHVSKSMSDKPDVQDLDDLAKKSLYDGIVSRLKEVAREARLFQKMAEKELSGKPLTNEEYNKILLIARIAEHNFLVFNSLSDKNYALSIPDPMPKIANVSGGGIARLPYLEVAVGNSMEWDNIVPFFGRREIVKGSTYSYYEFVSKQLLNDNEWRENVTKQEFLPWIKPYITNQSAKDMAKTLY